MGETIIQIEGPGEVTEPPPGSDEVADNDVGPKAPVTSVCY